MDKENIPEISSVLKNCQLDDIPEAICYLKNH